MTKKSESENTRLSTILSGAAGAYFVAAELSRRGYIATLTNRNARGIDLLVANTSASKSVSIQVKTNQGSKKSWMLNAAAEELMTENLFYVLVNMNGMDSPSFHIVESKVIGEHCFKSHRQWLKGTKRDGTPRKDTPMRAFRDKDCVYLNAWERLGLDE